MLEPIVADLRRSHPDDHPDVLEIESIVTATKHLPTRWDTEPEQIRERQREKEIVKRRLDALVSGSAAVRDALERSLRGDQRRAGQAAQLRPRSRRCSASRPTASRYWGVAAEEINYRRFFDINDLAAIRVEEPKVLEAVHDKAFQLLRAGKVTGLRIDHLDGLLDPAPLPRATCSAPRDAGPDGAAAARRPCDVYVVVEKILTGDEELPPEWPVHGTTGYEFLNMVNGLFVDAGGRCARIERRYQRLREGRGDVRRSALPRQEADPADRDVQRAHVLARRLDRISEQHRWSRDFTPEQPAPGARPR